MRICVPYLQLEPATIESLRGRSFSTFYTGPVEDRLAYARYFRDRWRDGLGFVNVEHDLVFPPTAIGELLACPEPLCFFQLGCAKITPEAIAATRDLWEDPALWPRWILCANRIDDAAKAVGFRPHCHTPAIVNLQSTASSEH